MQKCFSKGYNKRTHFTSFLFLAISSSPILSHLPEKYLTGFHVWGVAWLTVKFLSRSNITPTIRWQRHVRSCLYYIFVVCVVSHQNFGYPSQLSRARVLGCSTSEKDYLWSNALSQRYWSVWHTKKCRMVRRGVKVRGGIS